ncbi:hypothetical protein LCGC14_2104070 [marine sediment metagenome]|uniref:Uncharacterized protein n=1 Tax=marine sediment metagenome TaxID=412755 RepID=A0A0F9GM80_9ZZZZ
MSDYAIGVMVDVFEDPITRKHLEGRAMIIDYDPLNADSYRVQFEGEDEAYWRVVLPQEVTL